MLPFAGTAGPEHGETLTLQPADGIHVDDPDDAVQRVRRGVGNEIFRPQLAGLFTRERNENDAPFRRCLTREGRGEFEQHGNAAGVVVRSEINPGAGRGPRIRPATAEMIIMSGHDDGLTGHVRIGTGQDADDIAHLMRLAVFAFVYPEFLRPLAVDGPRLQPCRAKLGFNVIGSPLEPRGAFN